MKYMIPGPRENPTVHIDTGGLAAGTSSQDGEIEKRVTRLETESRYIRRDLDEIRGDTRAINDQLHSMETRLTVMEQSNDARFAAADQKMEAGFAAVHQKMDAGFLAVNLKIDVSVASLNQKMDANFSSIHQTLSTVPTKPQLALMALAGLAMILGSAFAVVAVLLRSTGHADVANVLDAARGES